MTLSSNLIHNALMNERKQYAIEREAELGRWRADIASMEMQIGDGNLTYQDKLNELKRQMDVAEDQLEELKDASGDAWSELRSSADDAWQALSDSFEKLKKDFQQGI